jgi:carbon monoxide dehydrogenase subunit G
MELEHSFTVPVTKERAWDVLLDVEKVAPCMPGATVDSFDGKVINGRMKVKVGPISMTYAGKAEIVEQDVQAGLIRMEASGKETKGAGTASASVRSVLEAQGPQTRVTVHTTMNVTGKPAQFGRGVMSDVSGKLIGIFAGNLADLLADSEDAGAGEGAGGDGPAGDVAAGPAAASNGAAAANAVPAALTPVSDLHLNARAAAALHREGLITAGDIAGKTAKELLAIDGIGRASVDEIKSSLAEHGIALASADSVTAEATETTGGAEAGGTAGAAEAGGVADAAGAEVGATPPTAGRAVGASKAAASTTAGSSAPTTSSPNGQSAQAGSAGSAGSTGAPPRRRQRDESLNLLRVAGGPVLKRSIPVLAGLTAVIIIGIRRKLHRRSS